MPSVSAVGTAVAEGLASAVGPADGSVCLPVASLPSMVRSAFRVAHRLSTSGCTRSMRPSFLRNAHGVVTNFRSCMSMAFIDMAKESSFWAELSPSSTRIDLVAASASGSRVVGLKP